MTPRELYLTNKERYDLLTERMTRLSSRFSFGRLIVFFGGLILFVILSSVSLVAAIISLAVSVVLFIFLIIRYDAVARAKEKFTVLSDINNRELGSLEGVFSSFSDGAEYISRDHPYSYDLDIFGKASLFQYLCRTTSKPASDMLAEFLSGPAAIDEIRRRQEAVEELRTKTDWRQRLMVTGYLRDDAGSDPGMLIGWLNSEDTFGRVSSEKLITTLLSLLAVTSLVFAILGTTALFPVTVLLLNFLYYSARYRKINRLHEQVTRYSGMLRSYSETIELIQNERFVSGSLISLQNSFTVSADASASLRRLSRLVNRLDSRLNVLISMPMNLLFFTDIHFCLELEKWKRDHAGKVSEWLQAMAAFEVLASLANAAFNNSDWVFPDINEDFFSLNAVDMGHPLIAPSKRITNNLTIRGAGRAIVVTGSNMSGKSTFLRTCGVNAVLAFAGAPVCASSFSISFARIHSSMRISDSLEDNISSFYAELRRLRAIIEETEKNPDSLLLLDEILRGTNSDDRFTGSVALIKQLTGYGAVSLLATHDLRLAALADDPEVSIDNYHFDVRVREDELFFDYLLTPGVCSSFNASLLMRKMGIRV